MSTVSLKTILPGVKFHSNIYTIVVQFDLMVLKIEWKTVLWSSCRLVCSFPLVVLKLECKRNQSSDCKTDFLLVQVDVWSSCRPVCSFPLVVLKLECKRNQSSDCKTDFPFVQVVLNFVYRHNLHSRKCLNGRLPFLKRNEKKDML